jgi:hypothetical protein
MMSDENTWLNSISTTAAKRGTKTVISGSEGVGKTSTGAFFPDPVFMCTAGENSLAALQNSGEIPATPSFPVFETWDDLMAAINELIDSPKVPGTLVLDALDGFEALVVKKIKQNNYGGSREKFQAYGVGWTVVSDEWRQFLAMLDELADQGTNIVILAHLEVKRFIAPDSSDYDRWQPAANKAVWALTSRWTDNILMLTYLQHVVDGERGTRAKVRGTSERIMYATPGPARVCKNRSGLQESYALGTSAKKAASVIVDALNL